MAKIIQFGIFIFVLQIIEECWAIPLPGVKLHEDQATHSSFFPYSDLNLLDASQVKPSFRDIIPKFNTTILEQIQRISDNEVTTTTTTTTTENPLANLLDKLYGSNNWRSLLDQRVDNLPISTTYSPLQAETTKTVTEKQTPPQGFYGMEISGNQFNNLFGKQEVATHKPNKASRSKFMMKIVGSRQYTSTDSPKTDAHESQIQHSGSSFKIGTDAPSMFMKDQDIGQGPEITTKPPIVSMTQKPVMGIAGIGTYDPNRANSVDGDQSQYLYNSGTNNFNPNQVNDGQHLFRPNSALNSFITQTGSDPSNQHLPVSYDPDTANERYMTEKADRLYQSFPGVAEETVYGKEQFGYRFSAYSQSKPQAYDADALNQAIMQSMGSMRQQPMSPMFLPASQIQPTEQSYRSETHLDGIKDSPAIHKIDSSTDSLSVQEHISSTTPRPTQRFNFIPGNLFPGQSIRVEGQQLVGVGQEASPPEFVRHIPTVPGNNAFNPNKVNAAQAIYNPNALSWIQNRDTERMERQYLQEVEEEINNATANAITTPPYDSAAKILSGNTSYSEVISTTPPAQHTGRANDSNAYENTGFDPNALNSNQGQNEFIPGQISPDSYGYMSKPYSQGHEQSYGNMQNAFSPNSPTSSGGGGPKMTFNIAQLLGINTKDSQTNTDSGFGQGTGSFNPNIIKNLMATPYGDNIGNSTANTGGFGMGFVGTGFDPNAANQGFSNILGVSQTNASSNQSSGYMNGYGGFDPNAANVGFGDGGFGIGGAGTSGGAGYMAAFDPNKVNQMAIQNPFEQGVNDTGSGNTLGYFLGSGQGKSGAYTTAYISAFNPDSVNQASYDPKKYNQIHLHLDPLDMLINNPGMDKDTLKAAASAFDPDRINSPHLQQAFSPIEMLSANPGIDKNVLSNLKYDPYAGTEIPFNRNTSMKASASRPPGHNFTSSGAFDPVAVMVKLMQNTGAFQPGNVGRGQQGHDPSFMFGNLNGVPAQSTESSIKPPTSVVAYTSVSTGTPSHSSVSPPSSTSPSVSLTPTVWTTTTGIKNTTAV